MRVAVLFIALMAMLAVSTGCTRIPPEVGVAADAEGELLQSYRQFFKATALQAYGDLEMALQAQMDIILDYELRLAATGDSVALARVQELITLYREKRVQVKAEIDLVLAQIEQADTTMEQALALHGKLTQYLKLARADVATFTQFLTDIRKAGR